MSLLLFIVALILKAIFGLIGYAIGIIISLYRGEFWFYHSKLAISLDQYGNTVCQYLFNWILIKKDGHKFGNVDETISSALGKNKVSNHLLFCGKLLDYCLNLFEEDHSIKSIEPTNDN